MGMKCQAQVILMTFSVLRLSPKIYSDSREFTSTMHNCTQVTHPASEDGNLEEKCFLFTALAVKSMDEFSVWNYQLIYHLDWHW